MSSIVTQKMDVIQDTFLRIQDLYFQSPDLDANIIDLVQTGAEFRSIAYESAAMSIAMQDLALNNQLANWFLFVNGPGHAHATQVHVGLGWALAQKLVNPMDYLLLMPPMHRYRVFDGYGYYEGIFRRRRSILNHLKLNVADAVASGALDQGVGRSLWYNSRADFDAAKTTLETFAAERQPDLWRGLGIAITYVGGSTEDALRDMWGKAGAYQTQLATGAAMALVSRHYAGYVTPDSELACKVWCGKTAAEIIALNEQLRSNINPESDMAYWEWVSGLETAFGS